MELAQGYDDKASNKSKANLRAVEQANLDKIYAKLAFIQPDLYGKLPPGLQRKYPDLCSIDVIIQKNEVNMKDAIEYLRWINLKDGTKEMQDEQQAKQQASKDDKPSDNTKLYADSSGLPKIRNLSESSCNIVKLAQAILRSNTYVKAQNLKVMGIYKLNIIDSGADICFIGIGWHAIADTKRRVNVIGFDEKVILKYSLPVVSAVTIAKLNHGNQIMLRIHQTVWNKDSEHTLLSDYQLREYIHSMDTVHVKHGGKQILQPTEDHNIKLHRAKAMMIFNSRTPTEQETINYTGKEIDLTSDDIWDPKLYSDNDLSQATIYHDSDGESLFHMSQEGDLAFFAKKVSIKPAKIISIDNDNTITKFN